MKRAYLDHAAATPVPPEVLEAMLPCFAERCGNPSAVYDLGAEVKEVLEEQPSKVAWLLGTGA
jgi:cysteine desulfurase